MTLGRENMDARKYEIRNDEHGLNYGNLVNFNRNISPHKEVKENDYCYDKRESEY